MSISSSTLNSQLKQIARSSNFTSLVDEAKTVGDNVAALSATSLGETSVDEIIGGIKPLGTGQGSEGVALLTKGVPGITDTIVKDVSDDESDLNYITGGTVENGFLDLVATSASAEGVKAALQTVAPDITTDQISTVLSDIVPDRFSSQIQNISDVSKSFSTFATDLNSSVVSFQRTAGALLGGTSFLKDFVTKIDNTPINQIEALGVPANVAQSVLNLVDNGDIVGAARLASEQPTVTADIDSLEQSLSVIDTSISGRVSFSSFQDKTTKAVYDPNANTNKWNGSSTDESVFSIVGSVEQQMLDFVRNKREITQTVVFGIETTDQQNLTANDIHKQHVAAGINGIGFHYIILANGVVQRGRPLAVQSEILENHNEYSIMIGIPHSGHSITTSQANSLKKVMKAFYMTWPGGKLLDGHVIDPELEFNCGFDVYDLMFSVGPKLNFGGSQSSLSTKQLIASANFS